MRLRGGLHRIHRDLHVAIRAVLETHRARQPGRELAMHLALRGARADGAPRHEIRDVLRCDHVEEFATRRQAQPVDVQQQPARETQPIVDAEAAVEVRIVDEPLPADGGARFLKIDAHHDLEAAREPLALLGETPGVLHGRLGVVNGARADHYREPVFLPMQDAMQRIARSGDRCRSAGRAGVFARRDLRE